MQETLVLNVCNFIWLSRIVLKDTPAGKYNHVALIFVRKSGLVVFASIIFLYSCFVISSCHHP